MPCPAGNVTHVLWNSYSAGKHLPLLFISPQTALPGRTSPICLAFWDGAEQRRASLCAGLLSISPFLELRLESELQADPGRELSQLLWLCDSLPPGRLGTEGGGPVPAEMRALLPGPRISQEGILGSPRLHLTGGSVSVLGPFWGGHLIYGHPSAGWSSTWCWRPVL